MSQIKPSDFSILLEVFRDGLLLGLISKQEVVNWADEIIIKGDEPDYFFIEMSLSGNELLSLLKQQVPYADNPLPTRVLLGLAYRQVSSKIMDVNRLNTFLGDIIYVDLLTTAEDNFLYQLFGDTELLLCTDRKYLNDDEMKFLAFYKDFNLDNHEQWAEINSRVEEALNEEQIKNEIAEAAFLMHRQKKIVIQGKWIYAFIYLLALVSLLIIVANYKPIGSYFQFSKFRNDLYQVAILYFYFFVAYCVFKGIYKLLGWVGGFR